MANCPKCDKHFTQATIEPIKASVPFGIQWNCISFNCPFCKTSLGMQIDPIAIKTDLINELKQR